MSDDAQPTSPSAGDGAAPAGSCTVNCPAAPCATDFTVDAPCRILQINSANVQMSASDLPASSGGNFAWTTASAKIRLQNANSAKCTVQALNTPSTARDAEVVTVTRTAANCPNVVKTVNLTVAKVTFSAAATQR